MASETIEIYLNKETNFDFELSITGISANNAKVKFSIELPAMSLQIPCTREDDTTWSVTVPSLDGIVEEGQYAFAIELIVDGHYFAPVKGKAKIAPVAEVSGSIPQKGVEVSVTSITPKKSIVKDSEEDESEKDDKKDKKDEKKSSTKKVKKDDKKDDKKTESVDVDLPEDDENSAVEELIKKRFKPLEFGKSILSQLAETAGGSKDETDEDEPQLTEQQQKVRDIIKSIK